MRDGRTGIIQCIVFKFDAKEEIFRRAEEVTQESSIIVTGRVRRDERSPIGYELGICDLDVLQYVKDYPITPKDHSIGFLMQYRHLWLRSSRRHAILRIRNKLVKACRIFFDQKGFTLLDALIFTPSACEGTTTLFSTDYFDEKAYLTQSGQLYMEAGAMALSLRHFYGIWISGVMVQCPIPGLAWELRGLWHGYAALSMSEKQYHSPECYIRFIHK